MTARFYIYRNLHLKDTFSIRLRGKVIEHVTSCIAQDVQFRVSERGRERVLNTKQKNVHAYAAARVYSTITTEPDKEKRISYNPYENGSFMLNGEPIYAAQVVLFTSGQCYFLE